MRHLSVLIALLFLTGAAFAQEARRVDPKSTYP